MPAWDRMYAASPSTTTTITTTAETVVLTSPPINTPSPNAAVLVSWHFILTVGTTTTSIVVRVRRTSLTGTQIYTSGLVNVTAGNIVSYDGMLVDGPADIASGLYVVTVVQTGATANGTIQLGSTITAVCFT